MKRGPHVGSPDLWSYVQIRVEFHMTRGFVSEAQKQMSGWTSTLLSASKNVVTILIVVTLVWFVYGILSKSIKNLLTPIADSAEVKAPVTFKDSDAVKFIPTAGEVQELTSDKTADAILSGTFGPAVVLVYAPWCTHCQSMTSAFDAAAKSSGVPFVKIQGSNAPVTSSKYGVTGYPTVFGVTNVAGPPRRFAQMRTAEAFLEFARHLNPVAEAPQQPAAAPVALPAAAPVAAPLAAPPAAPVPPVQQPPAQALIESMPPTVEIVPS